MVEPRTCVVEVTQIVPADDVPYVAARVAERLGMPLERVRKLIDDRTGPITRPLRPDKAEVIAQTFEAAGVAVAVRPATEEDEFPLLGASSVASAASTETPGTSTRDEPAQPVVRDEPAPPVVRDEPENAAATTEAGVSAPSDEPEVPVAGDTPEHDAPESHGPTPVDSVTEQPSSDAFEREATDAALTDDLEDALEAGLEADPGAEPEAEPEIEPEIEPDAEPEAEDAFRDAAAVQDAGWDAAVVLDDGSDEPGAYDVESEEPVDEQPETEPDDFGYDDLDVDAFDPDAPEATGPSTRFEADRLVMSESDDATRPSVPPRPPVVPQALPMPFGAPLQLDPELDEDDDTDDPGPFGWPARGEVTVRPLTAATLAEAEAADAADSPEAPERHEAEASASDSQRSAARSPFGDPSTWHGDDDPAGGWTIGPRATRRLPVVTDEPVGVADLADEDAGHEAAPGERDDAQPTPGDRPEDTGVPVVLDVAREGVDETREGGDEASIVAHAAADDPTVPLRVVHADQGAASDASEADGPPLVGRVSRIRDRAAEGAARDPELSADGGGAARVPTAWRGLGGTERGPARPVDARLPRRGETAQPVTVSAAARVTRRRTLMLVALAIALGVFVLAQAWVAGRAAPAFDAGLHRFRDADFGAARRVWTDLASHGDANAQFMLGYMSEAGLGRPWSARAAAAWYRLAADAGHAEARWRLGNLYHQGLGVPPDAATAERWWAAAADAGHAEAAFTLGRSRLEGASGASDPRGALVAFERAAALGWPAAVPYGEALKAVSERPHPDALP